MTKKPAKKKKDGKNILYSHPGASFGGFVFQNLSFEDANMLVKTIEEYSKQNKFKSNLRTFIN